MLFILLSLVDDTNLFISGLCANETVFISTAELESHNVWFRYNKLTLSLNKTSYTIVDKHVGREIVSLLLQGKHNKGLTQIFI